MDVTNAQGGVDYDNSPFLIDLTDDMRKFWKSETDLMVALQREYPKLELTISKTWKGQTLIRPLSNESQFLIYNMRSLRGKPIAFLQMDARQNFLTAILCKVPHALSEELLEEVVPEIAKATRLTCWSFHLQQVVPTMSVKILWRGDTIPYKVKVGFLGRYDTKSFTPEPNQCFKCLRYGHISRVCTSTQARCRLCGQNHPSKQCQDRRDKQEDVTINAPIARQNIQPRAYGVRNKKKLPRP